MKVSVDSPFIKGNCDNSKVVESIIVCTVVPSANEFETEEVTVEPVTISDVLDTVINFDEVSSVVINWVTGNSPKILPAV